MSVSEPPLNAPVEALDLLAGLLAEAESGTREAFYSRMAEATCRLAAMRRALIFVYDSDQAAVRAVGSHNLSLAAFADASPTAAQVALARRALSEDRVVEVSEGIERELPEEFHRFLIPGRLTVTPISAGGRWVGVILADRESEAGPLTAGERHTLWSLGKVAALAATARTATREHEMAQQLSERIGLAREVHDAVVQRLFGVSLALSGDGPLPSEVRARCREEIAAALAELRAALQRPLAANAPETTTTLHEEVGRLERAGRAVLVEGAGVEVPPELEPVAQSILREALRNAGKHASPTRVEIRLRRPDDAFVLEVVNDGVPTRKGGSGIARRRAAARGMGLRLAAFEALGLGGVVEFGPAGEGEWRVRLAVPL
jgi:signal transduction histidine kinase